ncbi:MAG: hypothetical protein K1X39_04330 [Thermoflexales bacterium]|nr:hypothetical protein [Thermoflexales bacterium]
MPSKRPDVGTSTSSSAGARPGPAASYLVECALGLEDVTASELAQRVGARLDGLTPGEGRFRYDGDIRRLLSLRTAQAVYRVVHLDVPRPRGLLGDAHFRALSEAMRAVCVRDRNLRFRSLRLAAAGADSAVMIRLRDALAGTLGLTAVGEEGDLLLRLRPAQRGGWEALIRLTPRPLATRAWRTHNYPGALNGAVAAAIVTLLVPRPGDVFVNAFCGSGTLLVERGLAGPAAQLIGIDREAQPLAYSRVHLAAAGVRSALLAQGDAVALPMPTASTTVITADLPFGHHIGHHAENLLVYRAALDEFARIARPGARLAALTHEATLMDRLTRDHPAWALHGMRRISLSGLTPRLYLLQRR